MKNKVPKLRFPEFSGEWEEKKLGDVCNYIKGFAFKSKDYRNEGIRIVRVSDLGEDRIKENNEQIYICKNKKEKFIKYNIEKGNIIITTVGSHPDLKESAVGRAILIKNEDSGFLNQNMLKLENGYNNNEFIYGYLRNTKYTSYIKDIKRGNANQANITVSDLLEYKIFLSSLPEQEKIASFLSEVDTKIEKLEKKKELLSKYKKGMMQKLFSQKLRFKDENGNDYPEWEEKKLGEICDVIMGQSPSSLAYNENLDGLPLIQGNADCKKRKIIPRIYSSEITKESLPNDIIMSVRAPAGTIAKSDIHSCIGRGVCAIRSKFEYQEFIYQYLINYEDEWSKYSQGSTFDSINSSDVKKLHILTPSLSEQEKIANFLSSIDRKIELVEEELEKNKEFKKGLLQQMFV
ncbi:MAG: restriction endonuclease subunit S [Cetobacterium sp.]